MTTIATAVFIVLFAVAATTGALIIVVHVARGIRNRQRARRAARPRRALLALAAGAGEEGGRQLAELASIPARNWRAVEPMAFELLAKVRGEAREALAEVFARRGLIAQARRDMRRPGPVRRARAASMLGSLGDRPALPDLCRLLTDPNQDVRIAAVHAVGRVGDPAGAAPLLASLTASQPTPSQLVAHSLVQLGLSAESELIAALDSDSPLVRATTLDALRLLGAAAAEGRLAAVLRGDPSLEVRLRAAATLGRVGASAAVGPLLAAADPTEPAQLRASAARALGELGAAAAIPPLQAMLESPDHRVAAAAAGALLRLGRAGAETLAGVAAVTGTATPAARRAAAHAQEALALADLARQRAQALTDRLADASPAGTGQGTR